MRKIHFLIFTLFFSFIVSGKPTQCPLSRLTPIDKSLDRLINDPDYAMGQFRSLLRKLAIAKREKFYKDLILKSPDIRLVEENIGRGGQMNRGVYRVESMDGRKMVLKLSLAPEKPVTSIEPNGSIMNPRFVVYHRDNATSAVIQNELAFYGIAPKIFGIYPRERLVQLFSKLKQVNPTLTRNDINRPEIVGILMEEIPGFKMVEEVDYTTIQRVTVQKMRLALQRLGIRILDEQIEFNKRDTPQFYDLEYAVKQPNR